MKLVLIITNLATGGAEMMLLKLLQNLDRGLFQPTVISLMGKGEIGPRIELLGIPVHALGMHRKIPNPLALLRLILLIRRLRPDVVHTWMYHADLFGGVASWIAGCRQVVWSLRHSNLDPGYNKRSTLAVVRLCARISSWVPKLIVSCSARAQRVHAAVGYVAEKIHLIPNGFEIDRFTPSAAARIAVRAALGLPANAQLVGMVARYDVQKNHLGFVQAAALVAQQCPQVHFVLVGQGVDSDNEELSHAIAVHPGLATQMKLLGRRVDVPHLMAAFDVLVSPSHGEAFPNVLGEAMSCGVPCVATDAGDSAEILGDTGRVVPVGDMAGLARELVAMLHLPVIQRLVLGEKLRERVRAKYDIRHIARMYEKVYVQVALKDTAGM